MSREVWRSASTSRVRQSELLADLVVGRLPAERVAQAVGDPDQLVGLVADMDRQPDRPRLVADRAQHGLTDPPGRIGRELEAAAVVELGDRPHQADVALLDQVQKRHPAALVLLRDRDHQAQVRLGHPAPRGVRAAFDLLGQLDLLLFGEQGCRGRSRAGRRRGRRRPPRWTRMPAVDALQDPFPKGRRRGRRGLLRDRPGRRRQRRQATRRRMGWNCMHLSLPLGRLGKPWPQIAGAPRKVVSRPNQEVRQMKIACVLGPMFEDSSSRTPMTRSVPPASAMTDLPALLLDGF